VTTVVWVLSGIISTLLGTLLGKHYAENVGEFIDLLKGIKIVVSVVGLITFVASLIDTYAWTMPTTVSSVDQLEQVVIDSIQLPVVFVLNWLLNLLVSIPLGIAAYTATYLATLSREQLTYYYY